jgi:hypothetical protein
MKKSRVAIPIFAWTQFRNPRPFSFKIVPKPSFEAETLEYEAGAPRRSAT